MDEAFNHLGTQSKTPGASADDERANLADVVAERRKLAAASLRSWSQASVPEPAELAWPTLGTVRAQMSLLGLEDLVSAEQQMPTDP